MLSYHSLVQQYPIVITGYKGNKLVGYINDGKVDELLQLHEWLDFWCDGGVLGSNDFVSEYIQAWNEQHIPLHVPKMYYQVERENLAAKLINFTGLVGYKVVFSNSGTEANELAIKAARLYWYKKKQKDRYTIYSIRKGFHGRTAFSLAASDSHGSGSPYHKEGFGPMPEGFHLFDDDSFSFLKYVGDAAAIMLATILANNGIEVYDNELFKNIDKVREKNGTLLILDEIQVGMARTGKRMAFHWYNIKPDIVTMGKGLAGGMPLSATIMRPDIAAELTYGTHFNTTGGNPLACWIALNILDKVEKIDFLNDIRNKGCYIHNNLLKYDWITSVSGLGLHRSFAISQDDYDKYHYTGMEFCKEALHHGLLLVSHRKYGKINFTPPLTIKDSEIKFAIKVLEEVRESIIRRTK